MLRASNWAVDGNPAWNPCPGRPSSFIEEIESETQNTEIPRKRGVTEVYRKGLNA